MSEEIRIISSDLDGADLRHERTKSNRYMRCDGTADDAEINEAIASAGSKSWTLPRGAWERIYGEKS